MNMKTDESKAPSSLTPMQVIVKTGNAVMMMERLASSLNDLPMVAPARRVMIVAETLAKAAEENEMLRELVRSSGVISHLRDEGRRRSGGEIAFPRAFLPDLDRQTLREGSHA